MRRFARRLAALGMLLIAAAAAAQDWRGVADALDFTPHGTQPGLGYYLRSSNECRNCHRGTQPGDATAMPYNTWAGSMMANATRDPVFWAALDVANHDGAENGFAGVGDYCLRCHAPNAWYNGRVAKDGMGGHVDGSNGCLLQGDYDDAETLNNDYGGETCHFCHRLMPRGPGGEAALHGNAAVWLDDADCADSGEPCRRGPYDYPGGSGAPPHPWQYSAYHRSGELCGSCHDVTSPDTDAGPLRTLRDAAGNDTGVPFPIERTYREWSLSDFADVIFRDRLGDASATTPALASGRSCQDCHMPVSEDPTSRVCTTGAARPGQVAVHGFAGGNTWVPQLLAGQYGAALGRQAEFAQTQLDARAMLQRSAQLAIVPGTYTAPGAGSAGHLAASVGVTNLSGHKLPTGYAEGRRAWLAVQVRDANGSVVAQSGAYDAASATLADDAQLRVYEVIHGTWDTASGSCRHTDAGGARQFHFVLGDCIAKDNRIPPLGFRGGTDLETQPVGATYAAAGAGRLANVDTVPYEFDIPAGTALPLQLSATLYYQTSSRDYIEFLRDQAVANAFPSEQALCAGARATPFTVGPQTQTRAAYLYQLWSDPAYGKSPPETVASATVALTR